MTDTEDTRTATGGLAVHLPAFVLAQAAWSAWTRFDHRYTRPSTSGGDPGPRGNGTRPYRYRRSPVGSGRSPALVRTRVRPFDQPLRRVSDHDHVLDRPLNARRR
ncbi:hypothetical protein GCM10018963_00450 [Saccharothrix longispora]